jgi:hypothetical protein
VVAYSQAMKAVDPTVRIGAVLTTPANWPDAIVATGDPASWNQTVLSIAGPHIDFVILHWYPGGNTAQETFEKPNQVGDMIYLVRQQMARFAGPNAGRLGIAMTELNTSVGRNTQPGALFAADSYLALLENGVFTVDWWNTHNGPTKLSTVEGYPDYDDFGILSSGGCLPDGGACQPALNTPFAPYHAVKLLSTFARPGDQFVRAATDNPAISAHAARRPNGDLAVLLANRDPANAQPVTLDYAGYEPAAATPTVYTFTNGATGIASAETGTATSQTLPPYSLTALVLHPADRPAGLPSAPGQPSVSAVTDTTATITWPSASAGNRPIAKYEVHRHLGAVTEQWGETSGNSLTVHNLRPGSRYTVTVLARDTAGTLSWSSPPLTVTTGAPPASSCAVKLTDVTDWSSGFVGSVDITNTSTEPIAGWTLDFTWPTALQQLSSGWNGTWTQTGADVKVVNAESTVEPGASVNIGFVGNYTGPNVLPAAFTLNGDVCSAG